MGLHEANQCNGGEHLKTLSQQWYEPHEITALRTWLPIAVGVNLLLSSIEWIREDWLALQLSLLGTFALCVLWLVLPDGKQAWKRDVAMGKAGAVLIIGIITITITITIIIITIIITRGKMTCEKITGERYKSCVINSIGKNAQLWGASVQ